jgi:hypothetical protein
MTKKFKQYAASFLIGIAVVIIAIASMETAALAQEYPEGMVSYWKFEESSGTTAYDSVGNNHGLIYGSISTTGIVGNALSFDGVDDYIGIIDNNSNLNLDKITVLAWIFPEMQSSCIEGYHYIDKRNYWNIDEYTAYVRGNGKFEIAVITNAGMVAFVSSIGLVNMNTWSNVAFTWDGSTLKVFHNGIFIGEKPGSGYIVSNSQPIIIGARADLTHHFNGLIDEVAIYNRALTEEEIQCHYQNGLNGLGYDAGCLLEVTIDIKPGSDPNTINLGSKGNVPVAIFSTFTFDAANVDPLSVTLAGASVKIKNKGTPMSSIKDVNGDGLLDLIVHVETTALELSESNTEAVLEGQTFDGQKIRGIDAVRIVPD